MQNFKMSEFIPIKGGGIYFILNLINGKIYVGRTYSFRRRQRDHFLDLRTNRHDNDYLQKSWNKYGQENFTFIIIRFEESTIERKRLENYYAWLLGTFKRDRGYNMNEDMDAPMKNCHHTKKSKIKIANAITKTKGIKLISPEGKIVTIETSAKDFCRNFDKACDTHIYDIINGKSFSWYGWRLYNENDTTRNGKYIKQKLKLNQEERNRRKLHIFNKVNKNRQYDIYLISPDNKIYYTRNLIAFCKEFSLEQAAVHRLIKLKPHHFQYKKWRVCSLLPGQKADIEKIY